MDLYSLFKVLKKNYVQVTYSAPESTKKSIEIVFKMSILDLQEAFLSGVRARQVQNEPDTGHQLSRSTEKSSH